MTLTRFESHVVVPAHTHQLGGTSHAKAVTQLIALSLVVSIILAPLSTALAADFKREVIYQTITDRFFDGSTSNNNPSQSFANKSGISMPHFNTAIGGIMRVVALSKPRFNQNHTA